MTPGSGLLCWLHTKNLRFSMRFDAKLISQAIFLLWNHLKIHSDPATVYGTVS